MIINTKEEMNSFNNLIYQGLRGIHDMSKKLNISSIVLVAMHEYELFADLLYGGYSLESWIDKTNQYFQNKSNSDDEYIEKFTVDKSTEEIFKKFIEMVRDKYDSDKFFKAVYEEDEYALAIVEMCNVLKR